MKLTEMTDMLQHINTIFKTLTLTRNNNGEFEYQQKQFRINFH
ncbi:hypothetical protein [Photobacterium leiognathi]|nr:hypothetical protein [Photobacterium leiognathi]